MQGFRKIIIDEINCLDYDILLNDIKIDYNNLVNTGIKFIKLIPFIDDTRKNELISLYTDFYNKKCLEWINLL